MKSYDELKQEVEDLNEIMNRLHDPSQEMIDAAASALLGNGAEGTYEEVQSDARIAYFIILKSILDQP